MNPKISADHLKRRAIVYIRQSSPGQVIHSFSLLDKENVYTDTYTPSAEIRKLHRAGVSKSEIAQRLQIGRTPVRRILG